MKLKKLSMGSVSDAAIDTVSLGVGAMSSGAIENVATDMLPASLKPYAKYGLAAGFITLSALMPAGKGQAERVVKHIATGAAFKQVYDIVTGQLQKVLPAKGDEAVTVTDKAWNGFVGLSGATAWEMPISSVRSLAARAWGDNSADEIQAALPSRSAVSSMA